MPFEKISVNISADVNGFSWLYGRVAEFELRGADEGDDAPDGRWYGVAEEISEGPQLCARPFSRFVIFA